MVCAPLEEIFLGLSDENPSIFAIIFLEVIEMYTPLYSNFAESFHLNFYKPETGLISPPTVTYALNTDYQTVLTSPTPPQSVFIHIDADLLTYTLHNEPVAPLAEVMPLLRGQAIPIIHISDEAAIEPFSKWANENNLGDVTLCVPYEQRPLLKKLRSLLPLSRGMLDCRGISLPEYPAAIAGDCQRSDATMILVSEVLPRKSMKDLQKRFVQVWTETEDLVSAICSGTCGIITKQPALLYDLYAKFPANSITRPVPLYAHKCYHVTEEYPENSIAGAVAAARLGYDADEIDIKLTKDDVLIVHHDGNTKNLFIEDLTIRESNWSELQPIRRKLFPDYGLDRFEDLMTTMAAYPDTPVLIEIKSLAGSYGVEETVRQMKEVLARPDAQQNCTCIMGPRPPHLSYVHEQLPYLPLAHCVGYMEEAPTDDINENNQRVYRFAEETKGANAGYNPYHIQCGADFVWACHLRGITVFPWTWAFKPWEIDGESICTSFISGFDGLTSDWINKLGDQPIDLIATAPDSAQLVYRDGNYKPCENLQWLQLDANTALPFCECTLPNHTTYCLIGITTY